MVRRYNPSLSQEPRDQNQLMPILPLINTESLLDWLHRNGRLKTPDIDSSQEHKVADELADILDPDPEIYIEENEEESDLED